MLIATHSREMTNAIQDGLALLPDSHPPGGTCMPTKRAATPSPGGGVGSYSGSASRSLGTNSPIPVQITNFTLTCDMYMTWRLFASDLDAGQLRQHPVQAKH